MLRRHENRTKPLFTCLYPHSGQLVNLDLKAKSGRKRNGHKAHSLSGHYNISWELGCLPSILQSEPVEGVTSKQKANDGSGQIQTDTMATMIIGNEGNFTALNAVKDIIILLFHLMKDLKFPGPSLVMKREKKPESCILNSSQ